MPRSIQSVTAPGVSGTVKTHIGRDSSELLGTEKVICDNIIRLN